MHAFAELLRLHRISAALSQEELAERADLSSKAVSALERGTRRAPYAGTVARLADALGLDAAARTEFAAVAKRARIRSRVQLAPHNLPSQVTSLIGREADIDQIMRLLARHRLITITGSGGVGKTRVAIEAARCALPHFRDGVWFCELAPLIDERSVIAALGAVLSVRLDERDPIRSLITKLHTQDVLLVLDSCEHLLEHVAGLVMALLRGCPNLRILATSRQRLSLSGEAAFRLPSLAVAAAAQLFRERAELADPHLEFAANQEPLIADICRKIDGIPLAIEIAAAQLRTLGIPALLRALDENLSFLTSGHADVPLRQRTLNATIGWSYRLLNNREQAVFRRVAIFAGDFGLDAARAVYGGEEVAADAVPAALTSLVDKSLMIAEAGQAEPRYVLLESARQFGQEKLRGLGEFETVAHREAEWAAEFVDTVRNTLFTTPRVNWEGRITAEFKNLYSAMRRMLEPENDALLAARILGGLEAVWRVWGRTAEAASLADHLLERVDADDHPEVAGRLLFAKSHALYGLQRLKVLEDASTLFTSSRNARELRRCFAHICSTELELGNLARAEKACARSSNFLALVEPNHERRALILADLRAEIYVRRGQYERAREQYAIGIELGDRHGEPHIKATCLAGAAELDFIAGDIRQALEKYRNVPFTEHDHRIYLYVRIAECHVMLAQLEGAVEAAGLALADDVGQLYMKLLAMQCTAHVAALAGDPRRAARLVGFVDACFARSGFGRDSQSQACYDALRAELERRLPRDEGETLVLEGTSLELGPALALARQIRPTETVDLV